MAQLAHADRDPQVPRRINLQRVHDIGMIGSVFPFDLANSPFAWKLSPHGLSPVVIALLCNQCHAKLVAICGKSLLDQQIFPIVGELARYRD